MTSSSMTQAMADVDKIVSEVDLRYNYKEWQRSQQFKDFSVIALLMLFGLLPLIVMIVKKIASMII